MLQLPKPPRGIETVLATTQDGQPLLVMQNYARRDAKGRPAGRRMGAGL